MSELPVPSENNATSSSAAVRPMRASCVCASAHIEGLLANTPPSTKPSTVGKYVGAAQVYRPTFQAGTAPSLSAPGKLWNSFGFQRRFLGSECSLSRSKAVISTRFLRSRSRALPSMRCRWRFRPSLWYCAPRSVPTSFTLSSQESSKISREVSWYRARISSRSRPLASRSPISAPVDVPASRSARSSQPSSPCSRFSRMSSRVAIRPRMPPPSSERMRKRAMLAHERHEKLGIIRQRERRRQRMPARQVELGGRLEAHVAHHEAGDAPARIEQRRELRHAEQRARHIALRRVALLRPVPRRRRLAREQRGQPRIVRDVPEAQ